MTAAAALAPLARSARARTARRFDGRIRTQPNQLQRSRDKRAEREPPTGRDAEGFRHDIESISFHADCSCTECVAGPRPIPRCSSPPRHCTAPTLLDQPRPVRTSHAPSGGERSSREGGADDGTLGHRRHMSRSTRSAKRITEQPRCRGGRRGCRPAAGSRPRVWRVAAPRWSAPSPH